MYEPPSGYADLESDVARVPISGEFEELEVRGVGTFEARRPTPRSASALAGAANGKNDDESRSGYLNLFVAEHLGDDGYLGLLLDMMVGEMPADAVHRVARALATWGTSRPYVAVGTLAVITGHHWRVVRSRLSENGIADPLTEFGSLHALLDVTERIVLESLSHSGEGKDAHIQAKRNMDDFLDKLYAPEFDKTAAINDSAYRPVPAGFDEDSMEDGFDSFLNTAR